MTTEIQIRYDGDAYGLAEGRLSLGAFLPALEELLTALRRIGSNIIVAATGEPERGGKGGRIAKDADALDLSIQAIHHNCVVLDMVATSRPRPGESALLFDQLPSRAGEELLLSIEAESAGRPRNNRVRHYLNKLPTGVRSQEYRLVVDGAELRKVTFESVRERDESAILPGLAESVATAVGVIFSPPQVQLVLADGSRYWCRASSAQVEEVLAHRDSKLRVLTLHGVGFKPKILRLAVGEAPFVEPGVDAIRRRLFVDWAGVMRKLA